MKKNGRRQRENKDEGNIKFRIQIAVLRQWNQNAGKELSVFIL
jgi:hypothetical protein